MKDIKILDKYISKQLIETFLLGIIIFTAIMFASDTFLGIVKQISSYGIPLKAAFLMIILKLPSIIVLTIPMGVLLSSILTFNKLSTSFEISVMRACGISITRLALPVFIFGLTAGLLSFAINEFIVPAANYQTRMLTLWAIEQRNIPEGKTNFSFKELNDNKLKRLFYIDSYSNKTLKGVTVLDMSKRGSIQILQSKYGSATPDFWNFNQGVLYTISQNGKTMNTTVFNKLKLFSEMTLSGKHKNGRASELNFIQLANHIKNKKSIAGDDLNELIIKLNEKFAIPIASLLVALIGVPLAITRPRVRFNRGLLFSILIIFCYYLLRAISISIGEAELMNPILAAWLPNLMITLFGGILFYRKAYLI